MVGVDLTVKTKSMFDGAVFNYGQANLGRGWTP
jgi:hypothetical protein